MNISCPFLFLQEMAYGCMYDDILQCQCYLIGFRICVHVSFSFGRAVYLFYSSYHPTIQRRGDEKGQVEGDGTGEERKRWGGVSGAITVVLVREETSIYLSLSEGIRSTFSVT